MRGRRANQHANERITALYARLACLRLALYPYADRASWDATETPYRWIVEPRIAWTKAEQGLHADSILEQREVDDVERSRKG